MDVLKTVDATQKRCEELRLQGKTLAFVPTMGFFHEGHLELMRVAKKLGDVLVISIFVNPTQFGPQEDLEAYPRDTEGDLAKAQEVGVDIVFLPSPEEIYPEGYQTHVEVERVTKHLCGLSRPGHFQGVSTVVAKLFNITKAHIAVFGQKDYQQLTVVSRMVKDLNMDIEIVGAPTVREPDGLAMSSRNSYLTPEQRESALCLKRSLDLAQDMVQRGTKDGKTVKTAVEKLIRNYPFTEIDYVTVCDPVSLEDVERIEGEALLALAVRVGKTRLIDNGILAKAYQE
jgi:pantoate--beta-alanine ligase